MRIGNVSCASAVRKKRSNNDYRYIITYGAGGGAQSSSKTLSDGNRKCELSCSAVKKNGLIMTITLTV
jgi:hypothetical protein